MHKKQTQIITDIVRDLCDAIDESPQDAPRLIQELKQAVENLEFKIKIHEASN